MLPIKNHKFQSYFQPAIARNEPWRLLVGLLLVSVLYFILITVSGLILGLVIGNTESAILLANITQGSDPQSVLVLLSTFIALFCAIVITVRLLHKRGLQSLLGAHFPTVVRNFFIGVVVIAILYLIGLSVAVFFDPPKQSMAFNTWLGWMVLGVPLLLIQVSAEELVFRGYIQQQLAARFDSRWVWFVLPSLLFGLLHYDPATMGSNAWLVVAHTFLFGLIAADVTARTGNLGAAIGLHFTNNLYALTIVTLNGSLDGLGLFKSSVHVSDEQAIRAILVPDLLIIAGLYGLYLIWCRNKPQL